MASLLSIFKRLKLRHFLFALLLIAGIVPLAFSSFLVIRQNREILETQEKGYLTRSTQFLSQELDQHLSSTRRQLMQLGQSLVAIPSETGMAERLRQPWVQEYLREFLSTDSNLVGLRVLGTDAVGPYMSAIRQSPSLRRQLDEAFAETEQEGTVVYRFLTLEETADPVAVLAIPITDSNGQPQLFVEGVTRLRRMETLFQQEARGEVSVFLIDNQGSILWGGEATEEMRRAVRRSRLVRDFVQTPLNMTQEYTVVSDGRKERMLGRVGPVEEAGWGVVMQRPAAIALAAVQEMVFNTAVSTAVLIAFALGIAVAAARGVSRPIQELADTTHQIAAGNFGQRVELGVASQEIRELADDFNRMSDHVRSHVEQLKRAAQINRDLFVGSMRSFVAAIDAKDPYTRGHSERVATYSRTISKFLGLSEEDSHQIWVGALLHDVGKIGIEDQILTKVDRLTDAEYDVMKQHTVIGAQIMSRIEQLKEMIPAIRWHHEAWNGEGYPDGLQGEQIPLSARIVAVADTFDAITTTRPYQKACDTAFAVETITKLAGKRFDVDVVSAFHSAFEAGQIRKREAPLPVAPAEAKAVVAN
ncbi:MAG: HD domain-containing phosphohydrolase [Thermoanaerobaculia bacterium]